MRKVYRRHGVSHHSGLAALPSYLGLNVEDFLLTGKALTPLERTYLTTGVLEAP